MEYESEEKINLEAKAMLPFYFKTCTEDLYDGEVNLEFRILDKEGEEVKFRHFRLIKSFLNGREIVNKDLKDKVTDYLEEQEVSLPEKSLKLLDNWLETKLRIDGAKMYFELRSKGLEEKIEKEGGFWILGDKGEIREFDSESSKRAIKQQIGKKFNDLLRKTGFSEEDEFFKKCKKIRTEKIYKRLDSWFKEYKKSFERPSFMENISPEIMDEEAIEEDVEKFEESRGLSWESYNGLLAVLSQLRGKNFKASQISKKRALGYISRLRKAFGGLKAFTSELEEREKMFLNGVERVSLKTLPNQTIAKLLKNLYFIGNSLVNIPEKEWAKKRLEETLESPEKIGEVKPSLKVGQIKEKDIQFLDFLEKVPPESHKKTERFKKMRKIRKSEMPEETYGEVLEKSEKESEELKEKITGAAIEYLFKPTPDKLYKELRDFCEEEDPDSEEVIEKAFEKAALMTGIEEEELETTQKVHGNRVLKEAFDYGPKEDKVKELKRVPHLPTPLKGSPLGNFFFRIARLIVKYSMPKDEVDDLAEDYKERVEERRLEEIARRRGGLEEILRG